MKYLKKFNNGIIMIIIGIMHTRLVVSPAGFGKQFHKFSESYFLKICKGMDELPAKTGETNFEAFAAFWFFYTGIFLIPLGLLIHSIEKKELILPHYFTVSYLVFVLIGSYMIPYSGMTFIMLPHAIYMLVNNYLKARKALII